MTRRSTPGTCLGAAVRLRTAGILFSHGNGSSKEGYGPLVDFWAAHGFVVIQPTHLDSRTVALLPDDLRRSLLWRFRAQDLTSTLDHLDRIEESVAELGACLDRDRIAAAGHSWGGQTVGMLLGAQLPNPEDGTTVDLMDSRIKAGVLIAAPGRGGTDLKPETAKRFPFLHPSFAEMTTPALIVAGDSDYSHMTTRGPDWRADPYSLSPAPKCLLMLRRGEHSLGGVAGYHATETTDENPERVAVLQQLTWAYLRTALYPGSVAWPAVCSAIAAVATPLAKVECK